MSIGTFTEKKRRPTAKSIESELGRAGQKRKELNEYLSSTLKLKGELKFYGVNYGWAIRYAKSGKSVIALYPAEDGFTVQIIMNRRQCAEALGRGLSGQTKEAIGRASEFNEGKWIYLTAGESSDLKDIRTLVSARLEIK